MCIRLMNSYCIFCFLKIIYKITGLVMQKRFLLKLCSDLGISFSFFQHCICS